MEYFLASKCKNVLLSNPLRLHFLLLLPPPFHSISAKKCKTTYCDDFIRSPLVEFPFQLHTTSRQAKRCGYPGFNLSCNSRNQTILTLPYSGDFVVYYIDYFLQSLLIEDPDGCLPRRFLNQSFTLSGSPFHFGFYNNKITPSTTAPRRRSISVQDGFLALAATTLLSGRLLPLLRSYSSSVG